ncbi:glycoside hydrolase family 2 protein [Paenibacillus algorifonticola]|uniref:beta-mannosidase n=1 Tax=Paenibacillus algorifonticola TaxID=684063 RepID=UPI003D27B47E
MNEANRILSDWSFRASGEKEWLPAVVPGNVHMDLLRQEKIEHPFYGTNEHRLQWIDKQDWEYRATFGVTPEMLAQSHLELVFTGLDTYADVYVNGKHMLSADNMFRSWHIDVKPILQPEGNVITVKFRSPINEDLPKLEKLGYPLPAANDQSELGGLGDKKISVFARKAPYHYGWDWGPRFVTSGIWKEVKLVAWSEVRLTDLYIEQQEITAAQASLRIAAEVECEQAWQGVLRVNADGRCWEQQVQLSAGLQTVELAASIAQPRLWWCRGLGKPELYHFEAQLVQTKNGFEQPISSRSATTGLRAVRLVTDQDEQGHAFYIELNGVPVFAKGANHIPNDSFLPDVTYERYRHEIASAALANMNMLRVWGGGIYEADAFYTLCDEYGLLVWQDFMFACSMYPGDQAFLENVRLEAEENVRRLRNHPCIAIWCGNNEIDTAWSHYDENMGWGWKRDYTPEQREQLWADYEAIFHRILPQAVAGLGNGIAYWPSSPMRGQTGDGEQHAFNLSKSGDIHYWGVWHNVEPFEKYNVHVGRFMSEYGFQSFPELQTVQQYAEEADMAVESEVMLAHQKNARGNQLIKEYMDMYLRQPKDFPAFLYLSQVLQAEAMKTAIEAHRRKKPFCMGSLYWQMNDCWPVASWAGMDYYGRWKALQYYAARSFRDIMLSFDCASSGRVDCYVLSDQNEPFIGELALELRSFAGEVLKQFAVPVSLQPNNGHIACSLELAALLPEGIQPGKVVLVAKLKQGGLLVEEKEHYFRPMNELGLAVPAIKISEVEGSGGTAYVLETDTLAKQVRLSASIEGVFSDNYFDLLPNEPRTITFYARNPQGDQAFIAASPGELTVHSMTDFI